MPGIPLEPIDAVTITTLVENVYDTLMPDQGPARRAGHSRLAGRLAAPTMDDQAIVLHVRDEGLVVITGCGHAGVANIVRHARALTGIDRVCAVIGGFHLNGPVFEPLIGRVSDDLRAMQPSWIVPRHCTGWRALHALGRAFGDAFIPNAVGTRVTLGRAGA